MKWASRKKAICLVLTGGKSELPYPLKEMECADGTVQHINEISDADKAKVLADIYPFADAPAIDGTLFDLHERKPIKAHNFLQSREMLVDWIAPPQG